MNINWKVRLKNKVFWATALPALLSFVYTVLGLFGVVPAVSEEMVLKVIAVLLTLLANLGVLVDPTTSGVSDSAQAMTYAAPRAER